MIPRLARAVCTGLAASALWGTAIASPARTATSPRTSQESPESPDRGSFHSSQRSTRPAGCTLAWKYEESTIDDDDVLDNFLDALRILQDNYFEPWLGTWPGAIDWTAAVTGTHVAAALSSLSGGLTTAYDARAKENLITTYFSQLLSYYFGQDAFAIRNEAYDDMLWVVLGWLELIKFINYHTALYQTTPASSNIALSLGASEVLRNQTWFGNMWVPAFSHRARVFWDISSYGWNTTLCGGGMIWNPRLEPYKNAITNELFISASASMYLYFPGDENTSPFMKPLPSGSSKQQREDAGEDPLPYPLSPHEPRNMKHLVAAVEGYDWLVHSGLINEQGLYTDGFHIRGWNNATHPNTRCDARNDMVYTYNQGVVLTGLVDLWKVNGNTRYLADGHTLVRNVIRATGYDLDRDRPIDDLAQLKPGQLPPWRGLGRAGVLEEQCDVSGECSQDSQTFKGIFFHHLTAFCAPLEVASGPSAMGNAQNDQSSAFYAEHRDMCASYVGWIRHNALAALNTKNEEEKFGMWWTVGLLPLCLGAATGTKASTNLSLSENHDDNSVDYRTYGVPQDDTWLTAPFQPDHASPALLPDDGDRFGGHYGQAPLTGHSRRSAKREHTETDDFDDDDDDDDDDDKQLGLDPNNRGRGRTVETQGGGMAVLRALWEISRITEQ